MEKIVRIKSEKQYEAILKRFDHLALSIANKPPLNEDAPVYLEMKLLGDLIEQYEQITYPIEKPSFSDILKLRLYERKLTQKKVAHILNISPARISEYLNGKSEPTISIARDICVKFDIDANLLLGI